VGGGKDAFCFSQCIFVQLTYLFEAGGEDAPGQVACHAPPAALHASRPHCTLAPSIPTSLLAHLLLWMPPSQVSFILADSNGDGELVVAEFFDMIHPEEGRNQKLWDHFLAEDLFQA
jgi:hypothetical protein